MNLKSVDVRQELTNSLLNYKEKLEFCKRQCQKNEIGYFESLENIELLTDKRMIFLTRKTVTKSENKLVAIFNPFRVEITVWKIILVNKTITNKFIVECHFWGVI
jgi:hypothetical protein